MSTKTNAINKWLAHDICNLLIFFNICFDTDLISLVSDKIHNCVKDIKVEPNDLDKMYTINNNISVYWNKCKMFLLIEGIKINM